MTTPQPQGWEGKEFLFKFWEEYTEAYERDEVIEKYSDILDEILAQKEAEKKALVREMVEGVRSVEVKYVWDNGECSMCGFESLSSGSHGCEDKNNIAERLLATITATAEKHGITPNEQ